MKFDHFSLTYFTYPSVLFTQVQNEPYLATNSRATAKIPMPVGQTASQRPQMKQLISPHRSGSAASL